MHALIVHGGAGRFEEAHQAAARAGCLAALELGRSMLEHGATALDVVERVVNLLEDDPVFDAGTGSFANAEGEVEMDAILVDGSTLAFGAVAAVQNVAHPISVARAVMERTHHCMLAGSGATRFARDQGFLFVPTQALLGGGSGGPLNGTVGAVALDESGHIATATSTGGTANKMPGRVGDSPLLGCGGIADDAVGGVSATGLGESLMRVMMARTTLDYVASGLDPAEAALQAIAVLASRGRGTGGVICLDRLGRTAYAYNTTHLARASVDSAGRVSVGL